MSDAAAPSSTERRAWLAAAVVITLAYHPMTMNIAWLTWNRSPAEWRVRIGEVNWVRGSELIYGLALALATPRASGLTLGRAPRFWLPLLLGTVLFLSALWFVYPRLDRSMRPFAEIESGFWLLSAPAQELVYTGFLFGQFQRLYPARISRRLDVPWAVVVTALFFSLWHVPNFWNMVPAYVAAQLVYTFVGGLGHALLRYWTGSVIWPIIVHMAVNWIAVQS